MYYCETSNRRIRNHTRFFHRMKNIVHRRAGAGITFLKAMVTPETTTPPMAAGGSGKIWFGTVKTLFWIANAIIMGILLAKVCC